MVDRRDVLKLIGAGGMAVGLPQMPSWSAYSKNGGPAKSSTGTGDPSPPWYGKELIRGHISWLHPTWTRPEKDFDAKQWVRQFERAGFSSIVFYSKFHDGVCNWPSKLQDLKPIRDFVGEISTEVHRRGLKIIIYYSAGPDEWAADRHPDWRCARRDGRVAGKLASGYKRWFKFPHCCPNSPYRDYVMGQIQEILTSYNVDGFWLDVMSFPDIDPVEPELGHLGCFCKYCREKYSRATGGGSLFDIDHTPAQRKWEADCYMEFFKAAKQIVSKKGGVRSITYNGCGHLEPPFYWPELQNVADYLSMEGFHFAQVQIGPQCRLARSTGKPYEIICVASGQTIGWTPKSTDLLLLEAATVTAHGGTYCCATDPTASGRIFDNQIEQLAEVSSYIQKRRQWLIGTEPVYDAGVFHPSYLAQLPPDPDGSPLSEMSQGWPGLLAQRNIPFAYLYPDSDLSGFKLIILDAAFPVSESLVDRIMEYVKQGGSVLAELIPGQLDCPAGKKLLTELLGVNVQGPNKYEAVYVGRLDPSIAQAMTQMPTLVEGPSYLLMPTTAKPLAYYQYPIAPWSLSHMTFAFHNPPSDEVSNNPAITLNRYGKGQAIYVGCSLGSREIRRHQNILSDPETDLPQVHEWALQLGENLALRVIPEPLIRPTIPSGVEVVINRQPSRYIVHLLNNLLDPALFSDNRTRLLSLADISLAFNQTRIGQVRQAVTGSGVRLPIKQDGKWAEIKLAKLGSHELIVVDHS